jgi:hypothetical protein
MSGTQTTTRASVAVILADLLVLQATAKLPDVDGMNASGSNGIVTIELPTVAAQVAWADGLGIDSRDRSTYHYVHRAPIHSAYAHRLGWSLHVTCSPDEAPVVESLPAETVAALSEVAAAGRPLRKQDSAGDVWSERHDGLIGMELEDGGHSSLFILPTWDDVDREFGPLSEVTVQPTGEQVQP